MRHFQRLTRWFYSWQDKDTFVQDLAQFRPSDVEAEDWTLSSTGLFLIAPVEYTDTLAPFYDYITRRLVGGFVDSGDAPFLRTLQDLGDRVPRGYDVTTQFSTDGKPEQLFKRVSLPYVRRPCSSELMSASSYRPRSLLTTSASSNQARSSPVSPTMIKRIWTGPT